jgi:hypothetical protein
MAAMVEISFLAESDHARWEALARVAMSAMYSAHARSSSARPPPPVITNVTSVTCLAINSRAVASATTKLAHSSKDAPPAANAPAVPAVVF